MQATEPSAEQLAAQAAAGCSASFERLVETLGPRLLRFLHRRLGDRHAAEDVLQETFLKVHRNFHRYDPSRKFATWLFTIAARLAASHCRRRRRVVSIEDVDLPNDAGPGPAEIAAAREAHAGIWAVAASALSAEQFTVLWLRTVEEMTVRETAKVMGKTAVGVKVLLHRARRRLMDRCRVGEPGAAAETPRPVRGAVEIR